MRKAQFFLFLFILGIFQTANGTETCTDDQAAWQIMGWLNIRIKTGVGYMADSNDYIDGIDDEEPPLFYRYITDKNVNELAAITADCSKLAVRARLITNYPNEHKERLKGIVLLNLTGQEMRDGADKNGISKLAIERIDIYRDTKEDSPSHVYVRYESHSSIYGGKIEGIMEVKVKKNFEALYIECKSIPMSKVGSFDKNDKQDKDLLPKVKKRK